MNFRDVGQEIRLTFRSLAHQRQLALIVVVTIGLAAGANSTVLTLVHGLFVRALPGIEEPERLVALSMQNQELGVDEEELGVADFFDVAAQCSVCEAAAAFDDTSMVFQAGDETERLSGVVMTAGLFSTLGMPPLLGRTFLPEEGLPGGERPVILSHRLWERRFAADPGVLGKSVTINGRPTTVIGVMPRGFRFPETADLWLPLVPDPTQERSNRGLAGTVVRLKQGETLAVLRGELALVAERLAAEFPLTNRGWTFEATPFRRALVGESTIHAMALMQGAVFFVLLIACANVSSLLLARELGRRRQAAIQLALGAGRLRVAGRLLLESVVLALAGGGLGLIVAAWSRDYIVASSPEEFSYWLDLSIGWEELVATLGLSLAAGLFSGLIPALRLSRVDLKPALQEGGSLGIRGGRTQRLQKLLVAGQIGLAVVLLFGASLFVRSSRVLLGAEVGFPTAHILTVRTALIGGRLEDPRGRADFMAEVVERLRGLPGVEAAVFTGPLPADDGGGQAVVLPEGSAGTPGDEVAVTYVGSSAGFFSAMGAPLLVGRELNTTECADEKAEVALVNRELAERLWPGQDPLGKRLRLGNHDEPTWLRVVGVVGRLQYEEFGEESPASRLQVHLPYARASWRGMTLMVRTAGDPALLGPAVRALFAELDSGLALWDMRTMEEVRRYTTWGDRIRGQIFGAFAVLALLLAALGIYGLMSHMVSRRRHEIGIRMALGADPAGVTRRIVGAGLSLAAVGGIAGLAGALVLSPLLGELLYGVSARDRGVLAFVVAILTAVALLASYLPARRAAEVEPTVALRAE